MERTTDLEVIRQHPSRFTWGTVERIHDIGRYSIAEYVTTRTGNERFFHIYIDGRSTSTSETTLERAILYAMAVRILGPNEGRYAANLAARMMTLEET